MSSLWTPGGEHRVGRTDPAAPDPTASASDIADAEYVGGDGGGPEELDEAALRAEIDRARARLAEAPPEVVVLNHAMGLYELGAIHLSAAPPNLDAAALAIDAFGYLVDGLGDRLGPDVSTLRDALAQIRLAFVQIKGAGVAPDPEPPGTPEPPVSSEPPAG